MQTYNRLSSCHSHRGDGTLGFFSDLATFFSSTETITKWSDRVSEFSVVVRSPTTSIANSNKHERYSHCEFFLPAKWAQVNTGLSLAMLWRAVYLGLPSVDKTSLTKLISWLSALSAMNFRHMDGSAQNAMYIFCLFYRLTRQFHSRAKKSFFFFSPAPYY